ncbi:DUF2711 family protein [Cytobacillus praedii]|uniref:DUF2711 family protein n=1 Tax=Cytobacillus praedii TaxID=1742358 RepID=UPI003F7D67F1
MKQIMIGKRVFSNPQRFAVCAPDGLPIKEYYKEVFEEIFVFYHPFIKPESIDYELFKPDTYPNRNEIRENCVVVTWKQFLKLSGIESFRKLDVGLRTNINGLREEYQDENIAQMIKNTCRDKKIGEPTEGLFPYFIMDNLLKGIKALGHNWIWCGNEFATERKLTFIDDIITDNNLLDQCKNLFTNDHHLLITTHWDSHFSLLCSGKSTVEQLVNYCNLEGFYCTDQTEIYWSLSQNN